MIFTLEEMAADVGRSQSWINAARKAMEADGIKWDGDKIDRDVFLQWWEKSRFSYSSFYPKGKEGLGKALTHQRMATLQQIDAAKRACATCLRGIGVSTAQIAACLGVNKEHVWKWFPGSGGTYVMKARRDALAPQILAIYAQGKGHKTIAKELGISPRLARTILIEQGAYQPGALRHSEWQRECARESLSRARRTRKPKPLPAWKVFQKERDARRRAIRTTKISDLDLFAARKKARTNEDRAKEMDRYYNDIQFRMKHTLRKRVNKVIKTGCKSAHTMELLGCTIEEFITHIEKQFLPGMTWDNHGIGNMKWNIDHIMPCAGFDLTDPQQQRVCFHFTNMRPLWAVDNLSKSDWMIINGREQRGRRLKYEKVKAG